MAKGFGRYSPALRAAGFPWDTAALDAWLVDPQAMIPGTTMVFRGIGGPGARADLIAFLERAGAPGGPEQLLNEGVNPEAYLRAQAPEPLADAPPTGPRHRHPPCGDGYVIATADGRESTYWEQNIRLKIDSAETGPPPASA